MLTTHRLLSFLATRRQRRLRPPRRTALHRSHSNLFRANLYAVVYNAYVRVQYINVTRLERQNSEAREIYKLSTKGRKGSMGANSREGGKRSRRGNPNEKKKRKKHRRSFEQGDTAFIPLTRCEDRFGYE